ncbi:TIP41-like family-domain-containing protein [Dunaliella salina]|uniref:TIP41-like family-domain-containing protein n=1 Tax=Dunaliella salina TaxID=3046 RepID=A0ABQ7G2G3_DUNSA|nr:TIP41-like family-domain-containing protein [Dunaliella salina]|eukprot:KAF5828799.1 TIP41-like family-domain-containing protein [Dunaliella salina]
MIRPHSVRGDGITINGWKIQVQKGPIISDKDSDHFRDAIEVDAEGRLVEGSKGIISLPEMLFNTSGVSLAHEPSGVAITFTAMDALRGWRQEDLPPLQVKVAHAWQKARLAEIQAQNAVRLEYDWTYTTPYSGTVLPSAAVARTPVVDSLKEGSLATPAARVPLDESVTEGQETEPSTSGASTLQGSEQQGDNNRELPVWEETSETIDRALLMEREPILFFDEAVLYESDLDDNGVSQCSIKLRVMPRAWLVLLRFFLRVDGSLVRLRETRLFCRHDLPDRNGVVLREKKQMEGTFEELRKQGAPDQSSGAYADVDTTSQMFQAVAPIGLKSLQLHKLVLKT